MPRGRIDDRLDVQRIWRPLEDPPAGGMAEDIDVRVGERLEDPAGHLLAILVEPGVHRGDDDVERGQAVVGKVERAVGLDVALDAGQQTYAGPFRIEGADTSGVLERAPLVQAVGHRQRLAVVGDGDVLQAGVPRRRCHRSEIVFAVGLCGVHVQIAAQIRTFDETRKRARLRRLDLAAELAKLRRDPFESKRGVNLFFALTGDFCFVRATEKPVFVQLEPTADRAISQRDVVRFRSGEVLQGGAAALHRDETQIGLEPSANQDARLRLAVAEHTFNRGILHEVVHQRCRGA